MFVAVWILLVAVVLTVSATYALRQGQPEDAFAASLAFAGVAVMLLTLIAYPLTGRRRKQRK
jgi:hypothetical protein